MQEDSNTKSDRGANIMMDLANVAILIILTASIVFDRFSINIAIGSSLLIWLIFGGFYSEIKQKWMERQKLVDLGIPLHQFCSYCSLRFSFTKNQCPRCEKMVLEKTD